jgi:hypothetical protein
MSTPKGYELLLALHDRPGCFAAEDPRLVAGDHVKVGFKTDPPPKGKRGGWPEGEWMWLEVTAAVGAWPGVVYRGELRNRPLYIGGLAVGCPVEFRPGEIYDVVHDSPDRPEGERESPPGRGRPHQGDQLWVICTHVRDGTAAEVWCRPDRIAVCEECATRGPEKVPGDGGVTPGELFPTCPACLADILRKHPALALGREYLERDGVLGHVGHNQEGGRD